MGCLKSKPKSRPHTVVVHTCDYHSHSNGTVVHRLKSRSPSPARYIATDSPNIHEEDVRYLSNTGVARRRNETPSRTKAPSPQITLPSTPEEERNTLNVLDAEDLEPADCNPAPETETDAETKTSQFDVKSQATVSKVTLKPVGSGNSSQTQGSKQSILSSRDTLTIEELDSDLDDFSRMSQDKCPHKSARVPTPAPAEVLLPLRKQKQEQEEIPAKPVKLSENNNNKTEKLSTKTKQKKTSKTKRKHKEKATLEKVKELSKENIYDDEIAENIDDIEEIKIHNEQHVFTNTADKIPVKVDDRRKLVEDGKQLLQTKERKQIVNENIKKNGVVENNQKSKQFSESKKESENIISEAVESAGGISLEYREERANDKHVLQDAGSVENNSNRNSLSDLSRVASPLPKDVYQKELERVRLNRKRKRRTQRRNPDDTPRVPKPGDTEAMGYLGSNVIFRTKQKSSSGSDKKTFEIDTDTVSDIGSDSRLSIVSDLSSLSKSNELITEQLIFSDKNIEKDVDLYSLDSTDDKHSKFFTEKKNSLILADLQSGSSTSDVFTKQKFLYSKFERRPYSESVLRLAGRPPLPPDPTPNVNRPVSEKVRRAQAYSRYFTPDMDML